jgi:SAM-dependent methyltransferase
VLEVGGGNGLQARTLADAGLDVVSIDIESAGDTMFYPVQIYDGRAIPFEAGSFDYVFSSNALEHVENIEDLLRETARVLKPGGVAIHIVPTALWRFWTSVAHYPYIVKFLVTRRHSIPTHGEVPSVGSALRKRGLAGMLARVVVPPSHGGQVSSLAELYYFSRRYWRRTFDRAGFEIVQMSASPAFYTGYGLFSGCSLRTRRRMARLLGPACTIVVARVRAVPPG